MVAVGELAVQRGSWSRELAERQRHLIERTGLPTRWPSLDDDAVLTTLQGDKKVRDGRLRFVLPRGIGDVEIEGRHQPGRDSALSRGTEKLKRHGSSPAP